jgi:hypothetical protein
MNLDPAIAADLGALLHELSQNPKTRKTIAKAIRDAKPDSPHAQAFKDIEIEDRFESFREEQAAAEVKRQQDIILARMNQQRASLISGGPDGQGRKYGEDDVKKIEALMQQKGISDYDDGAILYAATLPPLDPQPNELPPQHGATWEFPEWGKFGSDPVKASRDTAHNVITEFMRKR